MAQARAGVKYRPDAVAYNAAMMPARVPGVVVLSWLAVAVQDSQPDGMRTATPTDVVVPAACASRPGDAANAFPFTGRPTMHYQAFLAPEAFAHHPPGPLVLHGVAFRSKNATLGGRRASLEVRLGTLPGGGRLGDVSTQFANNLGADELVVLPVHTLTLEPRPPAAPGQPADWDIELRFARPFTYRRDRVLVLDIRVRGEGERTGGIQLDAHKEPFATRLYGDLDSAEGKVQTSFGLVTRFLLAPPAASRAAASRPAASQPGR